MRPLLLLLLLLGLASAPTVADVPRTTPAKSRPKRESKDLKLLYFHASWCGPCAVFEKLGVLDAIRSRVPGLPIETVDVDVEPHRQDLYRVATIPNLVLVDRAGSKLAQPQVRIDDPDWTVQLVVECVKKATGT